VTPVDAHAPVPHDVDVETKSSSIDPSQSLSFPSQRSVDDSGDPAEHVSTISPFTQSVSPPEVHTPVPHDVDVETKSSSTSPSQSLSFPSQRSVDDSGDPAEHVSTT